MTRNDIAFDEEQHRYWLKPAPAVKITGITGVIGRRLGKKFPDIKEEKDYESQAVVRIRAAAQFGSSVHKQVEDALMRGKTPAHPLARAVVKGLTKRYTLSSGIIVVGEMLVSDYRRYATAIDIAVLKPQPDGTFIADIFDIKTGNFDREYCSWQLGMGGLLMEKDGDIKLGTCHVFSTKDKEVYDIEPKPIHRIRSLFYGEL